jgi:hypothetical protein
MTKRKAISRTAYFAVLKRDNYRCRYCNRSREAVELHVDHIQPVSKGGSNEQSNLCAACIDCNLGKAAIDLFDLDPVNKATSEREKVERLGHVICQRFSSARELYAKELLEDARACGVEWDIIIELCATAESWWSLTKSLYWVGGCFLEPAVVLKVVRGGLLGTSEAPAEPAEPEKEPVLTEFDEIQTLGADFLERLRPVSKEST